MKVIDNETIEIASYRNPRIVFNDYRYDDIERYCDFKATINPFVLYGENERLHNIIKEVREYINSNEFIGRIRLSSENKQAINKLLEILDKAGNSND